MPTIDNFLVLLFCTLFLPPGTNTRLTQLEPFTPYLLAALNLQKRLQEFVNPFTAPLISSSFCFHKLISLLRHRFCSKQWKHSQWDNHSHRITNIKDGCLWAELMLLKGFLLFIELGLFYRMPFFCAILSMDRYSSSPLTLTFEYLTVLCYNRTCICWKRKLV